MRDTVSVWKTIDRDILYDYFHYPKNIVADSNNTFYESTLVQGENHSIVALFLDANQEEIIFHFLYIDDDTLVGFDDYNPLKDGGNFTISQTEGHSLIKIMSMYENKLKDMSNEEFSIVELVGEEMAHYGLEKTKSTTYYRLNSSVEAQDTHTLLKIDFFGGESIHLTALHYSKNKDSKIHRYSEIGAVGQLYLNKTTLKQFIGLIKEKLKRLM